jgi:hypothetical protein
MATILNKTLSPAEIAQKLQNEVDSIMSQVTEKEMYAEFREIDLVELENGVEHHIHETKLDERINYKLANHHGISEEVRIYEWNDTTLGKITRAIYLLFKPFQW